MRQLLAPGTPSLRSILTMPVATTTRVVGRLHGLVPATVAPDLEVAAETHIGLGQQLIELADHRLGALMVRRHPGTHQAEWRRLGRSMRSIFTDRARKQKRHAKAHRRHKSQRALLPR